MWVELIGQGSEDSRQWIVVFGVSDDKVMCCVQVVMRKTALPISLLNETAKNTRVHILDTEPYSTVFGRKKTRKRPNLKVSAG